MDQTRISGTRPFLAGVLGPMGCKVEPPWIRLVPEHPMDPQLDWDLGN